MPTLRTFVTHKNDHLAKPLSKPSTNVLSKAGLPLSKREKEVLKAAAEGMRVIETAQHLHISVDTVESHRKSIFKKMQVRSIAAAIVKGLKEGIIQ